MKNKDFLKDLCKREGFEYYNAGSNLGMHHGYNYLISKLPKDCKVFVLYDGDSWPVTENWHIPLLAVHNHEAVLWSGLYSPWTYKEFETRSYTPIGLEGYKVRIANTPVIISIAAYNVAWLNSVGGLQEPNKYYGGLECEMFPKLPWGKYLVYLDDYKEDVIPIEQDAIYRQYKRAHAFESFTGSLEEYMTQNGF